MANKLENMLKEWNDPHGYRNVPEAEDLITELVITLAGKDSVIQALKEDIEYYKLRVGCDT